MLALRRSYAEPAVLLLGLAGALALRLAVAGNQGAGSESAGLLFAVALLALVVALGTRFGKVSLPAIAIGIIGGLVLVAGPLILHIAGERAWIPAVGNFAAWGAVVTVIAASEEMFLRGALFSLIERSSGLWTALGVTSLTFALVHVPLYGWHVLPLDLAVGLWLGALRVFTGSFLAPAVAHALADLAGWWLL